MKTNERTMKRTFGRAAGALLVLSLLASCAKSPAEPACPGAAVRFGAATTYPNDERTRTEYSGYDENGALVSSTSQYERIDWVSAHDRVRILCAQARGKDGTPNPSGDYSIGSPSANGKVSEAGASAVEGTEPFYWVNGETYTFYALYPAPGTTSNYHEGTVSETDSKIESLSGDKAKITGYIPASQSAVRRGLEDVFMPNMNFAYMYAQKRTARTEDNYVQLDFYPLVTAFEFSLTALDDAMGIYDLTTLSLSSASTDMSGSFEATLDASSNAATLSTTGTCGREITVSFPAGTKLKKNAYTKVTVLALGVAQTDLTLRLYFSNGHSRSLLLKRKSGGNVTVGACKKAYFRLTVPSEEIFYEVTPMTSLDGVGGPSYQPVTRGLDEIDNSSDRGIIPQRYGVYAIRNGEGVDFDEDANPANWYFQNSDVSYIETLGNSNTLWCGNPPVFWPSFDRLNFFAYAPYMQDGRAAGETEQALVFPSEDYVSGMLRATYTPTANVTRQVDLCIGTPALNWTKGDGNVPFTFKHALTRVRLYVRVLGTRQPGYEYRVTSAIFTGLVGSNSFTYVNDPDVPYRWDTVTAGTPHEDGYTLTYNGNQLTTDWVKFVGDPCGEGITDPYTHINALDNGRLYLIPQTLTSDAKLEIDISLYKVNGASATLQAILPPFDMDLPTATAWEAGKTVSYLITVDATKLVVLDIKAMVSEWESAGNSHDTQTIF